MLSCAPEKTGPRRPGLPRACMLVLAIALAATGCVERRMVIVSDPIGAIVINENNQPIGAAPVDKPFTYYGKYRFRLVKDGYETLDVEQCVKAPWYEWPGLDFISENLIPWVIRDIRVFHYKMEPLQVRTPEQVLSEAQLLRTYGMGIGEPAPLFTPPPPPIPTGTILMPPVP